VDPGGTRHRRGAAPRAGSRTSRGRRQERWLGLGATTAMEPDQSLWSAAGLGWDNG